jgi:hypothetical protein
MLMMRLAMRSMELPGSSRSGVHKLSAWRNQAHKLFPLSVATESRLPSRSPRRNAAHQRSRRAEGSFVGELWARVPFRAGIRRELDRR